MPSDEPNKKMDDLLKAYAAKRREEAPPELHAVSRKLLQDEVRRNFGADKRQASGGLLSNWPRVAVGMCAAGLVIVVAIISFQAPSPATLSEFRSEQRVAPSSVTQLSGEAEKVTALDAATAKAAPAVQSPMLAAPPSTADVPAPSAPPSAVAAAPQLRPAQNAVASAQAAPGIAPSEPSVLTFKRESSLAPQSLADNLSVAPNAQQFVQVNNSALTRKTGPSAAAVLVTFQMERQGQDVRVLDGDGSVYKGKVLGPIEAEKLRRQKDDKLQEAAQAVASADRLGYDYSFEVSGVNNVLKKKIIFTGNFVQLPQAVAAPQSGLVAQKKQSAYGSAPGGVAGGEKGGAQLSLKTKDDVSPTLQNSNQNQAVRVTGKVQVGGGEFEIEAQPPQP
jgi:cytoskeletal protein RodZ